MSQNNSSPPPQKQQQQQRSRSNSLIRIMSTQNSPTQSPTTSRSNTFKRSMSVSEGLHVRLPALHHSETNEPFPYSPVIQTPTQQSICPSESNWANKYDDFDIGKPIGYGSSAVVYEAIYKPLRKRVAVKMIDLDMFERNQIDELRRETALMALSKHPNVLRVYGSFVNGSKLYIVTPYLAAGSCLDIMKSSFPDGFDEISIATILKQALEGLVYLHKNGHIHRDVKAGNLLMDQEGTVLLADFGVSSSLAENGDVRKTFVGTPCWMAPEVMEQAGYDYKADIWSFGITSLELATGHAPFAKFPPMKVLMMTLSNAPPTLDREHTKHKYSKYLKEMIDLCLQKEPSKRPSAEKLLLHPFFKQAKKRDFLVKSVLSHVLPLDKRPHRKIPQKHISFESTEQWDFDDTHTEEDVPKSATTVENPIIPMSATSSANTSAISTPIQSHPDVGLPIISSVTKEGSAVPLERSKSMVQFEEHPKPSKFKPMSVSASPADPSDLPPKKHISFGEVVIKDPSNMRSIMTPVVESPPIIVNTPIEPTASAYYPPPTLQTAPAPKKSRFVIEDSAPNSNASSNTSPGNTENATPIGTPLISSTTDLSSTGVGLGISTAPSNTSVTNANTVPTINNSTPSSAAAAANISSNNSTLQEGEFKKGRFSVNQTPVIPRPGTPLDEYQQFMNGVPSIASNNNEKSSDLRSMPMARNASQDSFGERKSRFEIKHTNNNNVAAAPVSVANTPIEPSTPLQSLPLTRENSNTSALSRDSNHAATATAIASNGSKVSRFSIEKPEAVGPCCELPAVSMSPECRKKGRFELTGGNNDANKDFASQLESPQSTVNPSPITSPCNSISRGQAHRILDPSMPHMIYSHMESLLKQTEVQKAMLHDLLATMPLMYNGNTVGVTRSRTVSDSKKPSSAVQHQEDIYQRAPTSGGAPSIIPPSSTLTTDINATVEHLQQLLLSSSKERERLSKENEALRREVDRLKKSQQQQAYQQSILKKPLAESPLNNNTSPQEKSSTVAQEAQQQEQ